MNDAISMINGLSDAWVQVILRACWQGAIAVLAVWLVCRVWIGLSPRVQCWLWRLAYLKVLLVFLWQSPIELPWLPPEESTPAQQETVVSSTVATRSSPQSPVAVEASFSTEESYQTEDADPSTTAQSLASKPVVVPAELVNWQSWLMLAWLIGVGFCLVRIARSWRSATRMLTASRLVEPTRYREVLSSLCESFRIRSNPSLAQSEQIHSPLLYGVWRPTIILSNSPHEPQSLHLMLAHELAHLKRRDLLWNWLPTISHVLFFFHPLLWLTRHSWRLAQEAAADELAIEATNSSPSQYCDMLLAVASASSSTPATLAGIGILDSYESLKARLEVIGRFRPMSRKRLAAWTIALVLCAVGGLLPWKIVAEVADDARTLQGHALVATTRIDNFDGPAGGGSALFCGQVSKQNVEDPVSLYSAFASGELPSSQPDPSSPIKIVGRIAGAFSIFDHLKVTNLSLDGDTVEVKVRYVQYSSSGMVSAAATHVAVLACEIPRHELNRQQYRVHVTFDSYTSSQPNWELDKSFGRDVVRLLESKAKRTEFEDKKLALLKSIHNARTLEARAKTQKEFWTFLESDWEKSVRKNRDPRRSLVPMTATIDLDDSGNTTINGRTAGVDIWQERTLRFDREVYSVKFSHGGKMLAVGTSENVVQLRHTTSWRPVVQPLRGMPIVAFSPDDHFAATGDHDGNIRMWKIGIDEPIWTNMLPRLEESGVNNRITSLVFLPQVGTIRTLASGSTDGVVRVWQVASGELQWTRKANSGSVVGLTYSAEENALVEANADGTISLWGLPHARQVRQIDSPFNVTDIATSRNGTTLAAATNDHTVALWNLSTGKLLHSLKGHTQPVLCVAMSPDGQLVASGSFDSSVKVWDVRTGKLLHTLKGHGNQDVCGVAFSPNGKFLASAGGHNDRTVTIWHVRPPGGKASGNRQTAARKSESWRRSLVEFPDRVPDQMPRRGTTSIASKPAATRQFSDFRQKIDKQWKSQSNRSGARLSSDACEEHKTTLQGLIDKYPQDSIVIYARRWLILLDWLAGKAASQQTAERLLDMTGEPNDSREAEFTRAFAMTVLYRDENFEHAGRLFRSLHADRTPKFGWFAFAISWHYRLHVEELAPLQPITRPGVSQAERDFRQAKQEYADFLDLVLLPQIARAIEKAKLDQDQERDQERDLERLQLADCLRSIYQDGLLVFNIGLDKDLEKRINQRLRPKLLAAWRNCVLLNSQATSPQSSAEQKAGLTEIGQAANRLGLDISQLDGFWKQILESHNQKTEQSISQNWSQSLFGDQSKYTVTPIDDSDADISKEILAVADMPLLTDIAVSARMLPPKGDLMGTEVTVRNQSKKPINVVVGQRSGMVGFARFEGRNPDDKPIWMTPPDVIGTNNPRQPQAFLVTLNPGQLYSEITSIHLPAPAALFPNGPEDLPSRLRCQVSLHDGQSYRWAISDWTEVKEPRPDPAKLPPWGESDGGLRARIRMSKQVYRLGEYVVLYGQVENVGKGDLEVTNDHRFEVNGNDLPKFQGMISTQSIVTVKPGDSQRFSFSIEQDKFGIDKPGKYTIQLIKSSPPNNGENTPGVWYGLLKSNLITLNVVDSPKASTAEQIGKVSEAANAEAQRDRTHSPRGYSYVLPSGWKAFKTSYTVKHYRDVFLCINSAGIDDLKVTDKSRANGASYDPGTVVEQLSPGTVYVDFAYFEGPARGPRYGPGRDALGSDLSELLKDRKPKTTADGTLSTMNLSFTKWGHAWSVYVYFREPVPAATKRQAIQFLHSLRFADKALKNMAWVIGAAIKELPTEQLRKGEWPVTSSVARVGRYAIDVKSKKDAHEIHFRLHADGSSDEISGEWQVRVTANGQANRIKELTSNPQTEDGSVAGAQSAQREAWPFSKAYRGLTPLSKANAIIRAIGRCNPEAEFEVNVVSVKTPTDKTDRLLPDYFAIKSKRVRRGKSEIATVWIHRFNAKGDKTKPWISQVISEIEDKVTPGMLMTEVRKLLGEPQSSGETVWRYSVTDGILVDTAMIEFRQGKVSRVTTGQIALER